MLKFPLLEGGLLDRIKAQMIPQIPAHVAAKADVDAAFAAAAEAVNLAFTVAPEPLNALGTEPSGEPTRTLALILFLQLMAAHVEASEATIVNLMTRRLTEAALGGAGALTRH